MPDRQHRNPLATVHTERHGGTPLVVIDGEVDLGTVEVVANALRAVADSGPSTVVVDVSAVTFIGVAGLATLLEHTRDRTVVLAGCRDPLRRIIQLAGVADRFTLREAPGATAAIPVPRADAASGVVPTRPDRR